MSAPGRTNMSTICLASAATSESGEPRKAYRYRIYREGKNDFRQANPHTQQNMTNIIYTMYLCMENSIKNIIV